ncbi:hypothetical protein EXN66_Car011877 [Channa argus]|uniref:Uncharacterized protein n=1 Tax=Channa argus TaxID=215402 RepID=A0A6G1Q0S0_CHAAH|nr:hypothetical protein EXN66_Car011877 [Channa argus]
MKVNRQSVGLALTMSEPPTTVDHLALLVINTSQQEEHVVHMINRYCLDGKVELTVPDK